MQVDLDDAERLIMETRKDAMDPVRRGLADALERATVEIREMRTELDGWRKLGRRIAEDNTFEDER